MSTLTTMNLKLGSNAGYTVPEGMMGYWIKNIPEGVSQPTEAEVLRAAEGLFTDIKVYEQYKTCTRTITMIALPRYLPGRPSTETKTQFLTKLGEIMCSRET